MTGSVFRQLTCLLAGFAALLLSACSPNQRGADKALLQTSISADGQMIATLAHTGTDQQVLRVRSLSADAKWQTIPAPPETQSIRFGLLGHELLLTHRKPDLPSRDYLSKQDVDKQEKGLERIYETEDGLAFPVEVKPGQVMVRTRRPSVLSVGRGAMTGHHWILVGPGQAVQDVGPETVLPFDAPNIVGSGFFWTEEQLDPAKEPHPLILSFPLPGGVAPKFAREQLGKNTFTVDCDQAGKRCLRTYIANLNQKTDAPYISYIYDVDVLFGAKRCKLPGLSGSVGRVSLTPDGNAAVMSFASEHDKPRHAVVLKFDPQQCEAVSVLHLDFEPK